MKRKFNRKIKRDVTTPLVIASSICLVMCMIGIGLRGSNDEKVDDVSCFLFLIGLAGAFLFATLFLIVDKIMLPDFEYTITHVKNENEQFIIFDMGKGDCRRINTNFEMVEQSRKEIQLEDGYAKICIPYNKNVIEFLNKLKE